MERHSFSISACVTRLHQGQEPRVLSSIATSWAWTLVLSHHLGALGRWAVPIVTHSITVLHHSKAAITPGCCFHSLSGPRRYPMPFGHAVSLMCMALNWVPDSWMNLTCPRSAPSSTAQILAPIPVVSFYYLLGSNFILLDSRRSNASSPLSARAHPGYALSLISVRIQRASAAYQYYYLDSFSPRFFLYEIVDRIF